MGEAPVPACTSMCSVLTATCLSGMSQRTEEEAKELAGEQEAKLLVTTLKLETAKTQS